MCCTALHRIGAKKVGPLELIALVHGWVGWPTALVYDRVGWAIALVYSLVGWAIALVYSLVQG